MPGCSSRSRPKPSPRSTGSWASTWRTSRWTGRCTKPPTEVRAPARTPPIGPSWAGSGRSLLSVTASRWAGRSTAPTATTCACSSPLSTRSATPACSTTSAPCTSTAPTTLPQCGTGSAPRHRPVRDPTPRHQDPGRRAPAAASRAALDRRSDQHMVVELRAAPPQHRPATPPPPRRPVPGNSHPHRRPPHRLAQPLEPNLNTYPLRS
jgi:hypothetical protein